MARHIGTDNLIPVSQRSREELQEMGRKGGKKAQEINAKKRSAQEIMQLLLNCRISREQAQEKLGIYADFLPSDATLHDLINLRQILEASEGNTKAAEFVRDTSGNKPIDRQEISAEIMSDSDRALLDQVAKRTGINPEKQ